MLHDVFQITCCVHYAVDIALVFAHIKLRMWYCSLEVCATPLEVISNKTWILEFIILLMQFYNNHIWLF
jgi:hypothetical protein